MGIAVLGSKLFDCDAPKIGIRDFGPFSETYYAEILGGTEKLNPPPWNTPDIQLSDDKMV